MGFCIAFGTGLLHMSIQDAPNGRVNFEGFFYFDGTFVTRSISILLVFYAEFSLFQTEKNQCGKDDISLFPKLFL